MPHKHATETNVNSMFPWMRPDTTTSAKATVNRQMELMFAKYDHEAHERVSEANDRMSHLCVERRVRL